MFFEYYLGRNVLLYVIFFCFLKMSRCGVSFVICRGVFWGLFVLFIIVVSFFYGFYYLVGVFLVASSRVLFEFTLAEGEV